MGDKYQLPLNTFRDQESLSADTDTSFLSFYW